MDWNALSAWIYRDSNVDWAKAHRYDIATVYIDPRSGNAPAAAATCRAQGIVPGIYAVPESPEWYPEDTPEQAAKRVSDWVQKAGIIRTGEPLMLDIELIPKEWVSQFLAKLRTYLPRRDIAYTNAPFQNETVVPVNSLKAANCHWYPQLYYGNMAPADHAAVMLEVCRIYPADMVHPFYDGNALPNDARDGCVFTLERLP